MDIRARKINFIQEFLRISNEELISKLEQILNKERQSYQNTATISISEEELNKYIDQAEKDDKEGNYKTSEELRKDIETWS